MSKRLTTVLHEVIWLMDRKAGEIVKREYGISLSWFRLLIILQNVGPVTQHRLAQSLNHSDPAVSKLLDRMSESGFVTVTIDPTHRRRRIVELTEAGRQLATQIDNALEDLFTRDLTEAGIDIPGFTASVSALADQLTSAHKGLSNDDNA
jgi:DNA-binding MarR family transcriptional regulator